MERFGSGLLLTSSQVADLLGVHVSSVKRWTNEGELPFSTTAGGHRRIHLDDALETARRRGIATFLDPFAPFQGHVWRAVKEAEEDGDLRRVRSLALGWLLREYPHRVGDLFSELGRRGRLPFGILMDAGLRAFLQDVGEAVRTGRLRAAAEHLVAQILVEALFRIRLDVPPTHRGSGSSRQAPRALVGALDGDLHGLSVLGARLLLERLGFVVDFLGPRVPPPDFEAARRTHRADLICVVGGETVDRGALRHCVLELARSYDPKLPYAVAVLSPVPPSELSGLHLPFEDFAVSPSAEALASWVELRGTRRSEDRKASA